MAHGLAVLARCARSGRVARVVQQQNHIAEAVSRLGAARNAGSALAVRVGAAGAPSAQGATNDGHSSAGIALARITDYQVDVPIPIQVAKRNTFSERIYLLITSGN